MHYIECVYIYCKRRVLDATAAGGSSSRRGVTCCAALPFVSSSLPRSFLVVSHALFSILHFALVLLSTLYIIYNIYIYIKESGFAAFVTCWLRIHHKDPREDRLRQDTNAFGCFLFPLPFVSFLFALGNCACR